ncbi:Hypothetical protein, putative, partial [Bodo saltans]
TTAPPPDVVVAVCSHSWSGSAAYSVTSLVTHYTQPPSLSLSYSTSYTKTRTLNCKSGAPCDRKTNSPMLREPSQKPRQPVLKDEHLQRELRSPFGTQRSNHHRQSVVEKQFVQDDIISSDSSTRQHHIYAVIIHSAERGNAGHPHRSTIPLDPSMVIAAGEEMCRTALECAAHRTCSIFGSAFIPVAMQRRHLLRLILMATQTSASSREPHE